jgi:hypothetical protein
MLFLFVARLLTNLNTCKIAFGLAKELNVGVPE